jgi:glycosyltransferase involved in cell wall biosynthesis
MISVIIPTRDRAPLLASILDTVSRQEWPGCPFEVLVVDNASVDETPAVVAAVAERTAAPIVYLREAKPGKSNALNTAVAHARGELLVFTDDDMVPSPAWLAAYTRAFAETGADYATGRILPLWESPPPRWLSPALHGVLGIIDGGTHRLRLAKGVNEQIMPLGGNMALRRHVLERVARWNPDLGKLQGTLRSGEDHEFALKLAGAGFTGVYEPAACMQHRISPDRLRLAYFQRWFYDNGAIVAGLEQEYPSTTRYLLNVPQYLWRQLINDILVTAWAILTWDMRRATAGGMQLAWFAGFLTGRWKRRRTDGSVNAQPAVIPRS